MARIIPCLDIAKGKVVKDKKFKNIIDLERPEILIRKYDQSGADEIIIYDIMASIEKRKINLDYIKEITSGIKVPFCLGGGITTLEDIENSLRAKARKISINSAAIKNPSLIREGAKKFGSEAIVLSVDAKKNHKGSWNVYIGGGKKDTGLDVIDWIQKAVDYGAGELIVNSIDRDGIKEGYDIELLRKVKEVAKIPVIASGGAGKIEDFYNVINLSKVDGVLAASVFHFDEIEIHKLKLYLKDKGVSIVL